MNISCPTEIRAQLVSWPPWARRGRCSCSPLARCRTFPCFGSGGYSASSDRFRVLSSTDCSGGLLPPPGVWPWHLVPHWKRRREDECGLQRPSQGLPSSSLVSWRVAARTRIDQTTLCSRMRRQYTSLSSSCPSVG